EIERRRSGEVDASGAMQRDERVVERNRGAAGRQAEHQTRVVAQRRGDGRSQRPSGGTGRGEDSDSQGREGRASSAPTYTSESSTCPGLPPVRDTRRPPPAP